MVAAAVMVMQGVVARSFHVCLVCMLGGGGGKVRMRVGARVSVSTSGSVGQRMMVNVSERMTVRVELKR